MNLDAHTMRVIETARQRFMNSGLVTIEQAAEMLNVSVRTIRRREASGTMPGRSRRGRRLCYRVEDLRNMMSGEA